MTEATSASACGHSIRLARSVDVRAIVGVQLRTWKAEYVGMVDARTIEQMDPQQMRISWGVALMRSHDRPVWVMTDSADKIVGFCRMRPPDGEDVGVDVELRAIYLLPETCGRGLGRLSMDRAVAWATEQGYLSMHLWVLPANERAIRLYDRYGFVNSGVVGTRRMFGAEHVVARYERLLRASA